MSASIGEPSFFPAWSSGHCSEPEQPDQVNLQDAAPQTSFSAEHQCAGCFTFPTSQVCFEQEGWLTENPILSFFRVPLNQFFLYHQKRGAPSKQVSGPPQKSPPLCRPKAQPGVCCSSAGSGFFRSPGRPQLGPGWYFKGKTVRTSGTLKRKLETRGKLGLSVVVLRQATRGP